MFFFFDMIAFCHKKKGHINESSNVFNIFQIYWHIATYLMQGQVETSSSNKYHLL